MKRDIKFYSGWVVKVRKNIPWYGWVYPYCKTFKFRKCSLDKLDLSKGMFRPHLTSDSVILAPLK